MISARFAGATALMLVLAVVPTVIHGYLGVVVVDGMTTDTIPSVLAGRAFNPTGRKSSWAKETLASEDWLERTHHGGREEVRLFVGRSYDAKRLYHHPELALLRGFQTTPAGVARVPMRPDIPLHVVRTSRDGRQGIAVYALLHDGRYVERPILFQLRTSLELLFRGRRAMTLFLAADSSGRPEALHEAPATAVLLDAVAAFEFSSHPVRRFR